MLKVALLGKGKMGQMIHSLLSENNAECVVWLGEDNNQQGQGITKDSMMNVDVAIDFTHPDVVLENVNALLKFDIPVVIGTTGWTEKENDVKKLIREHNGRVVFGSNFSLGVQMFIRFVNEAARLSANASFFDAAIHEVHHTEKADSPSGTALTLAKTWLNHSKKQKQIVSQIPAKGKVDESDFLVTAQRLGSVFGEHTLRLNSPWDEIELSHKARSREGFAVGAIKAAHWLASQKESGYWLIENVVEEVLESK